MAGGNLLHGNGHQVLFVLGEFFRKEAHSRLVPDVFQDGEYLGGLVEDAGMDLAGGKEAAQIAGLAELVGKQYQRFVFQVFQVHFRAAGQGMVLMDKEHEPAVFQYAAGVGGFRQMIGDTQGQIDFFLVQERIEGGTCGFRSHQAELRPGFLEFPMEGGENGIPAHGDQADPQQGLSRTQRAGCIFQLFVLVLEFQGLFQENPSGRSEGQGVVFPLPERCAALPLQLPDGLAETGLGEMQLCGSFGEILVPAGGDEITDLFRRNGHGNPLLGF